MRYRYTRVFTDSQDRVISRPLLRLTLVGRDGHTATTEALVDSGADLTTVNARYAEDVGLDLSLFDGLTIQGATSQPTGAYRGDLTLSVAGFDGELTMPALFLEDENVDIPLGQVGFFESFKVSFDKRQGIFELLQN